MSGRAEEAAGATATTSATSSTSSLVGLWPSRSGAMVADDTTQAGLINSYMQQSLALANREGRLISGFAQVMDRVSKDSGAILFCILPENLWCDKSHAAFFSLFLSTCHQSGVRMIKVDQDQLVRKIIDASGNPQHGILSYECMAIIDSQDRPVCDSELMKFCESRDHGKDFDRLPIINLMDS